MLKIRTIVNTGKQIIADRLKIYRRKFLSNKKVIFLKRISLFIILIEKFPKICSDNWSFPRQLYKQIYQHNFCFLFVRNKIVIF